MGRPNFLVVRSPAELGRRSLLYDAVLALWLMTFSISLLTTFLDEVGGTRGALGFFLIVLHTGAIAFRRIAPWPVLLVDLATALGIVALGFPSVVLTLTPLVALYSVAAELPLAHSRWAPIVALATLAGMEAIAGRPSDGSTIAGNVIGLVATWLFGRTVYERKRYVRELEERTQQLEEARLQLAERAVTEERLRIARELHDVVAHNLSMIAVQSGMGAHVIDDDPAAAKDALGAIEQGSRQALDEMRRLVGVLRRDGEAELAPAPGVDQIPALIERVGANGPVVVLQVRGDAVKLAPGADLTAYRIAQESLTNVLKHARADHVRVTLTYGPASLVLEIVDDGIGGPGNGAGHGLDGMRERAEMYGGTIDAGTLQKGGFRVRAELPFESAAEMINVLVVDDQALVRAGFHVLIDSADDLEVVGEAEDGEQAVAMARELNPDVILMDVRMPVLDGIEATRRIFAEDTDVKVIVLTTFDLDEYVHDALRAGASGFLLKDTPPAGLLDAIRVVHSGEALLDPVVTRKLIEQFVKQPVASDTVPRDLEALTPREREVLGLVARGMSNAEIAEELVLSAATAKTHVSRIMMKLHARDRAQLVVLAYETGLVTPGSA